MPRATHAVARKARRRRDLARAKGFRGSRSKLTSIAQQAVMRAESTATAHRRERKRDFRRLWITRISAACRQRGLSYSRFMAALTRAGVAVDRAQLADIAVRDEATFTALAERAITAK